MVNIGMASGNSAILNNICVGVQRRASSVKQRPRIANPACRIHVRRGETTSFSPQIAKSRDSIIDTADSLLQDSSTNYTKSKTTIPQKTLQFVWDALYNEKGEQWGKEIIKDTDVGDVVDSLKKVLGLKTDDVLQLMDDIKYTASGNLEWVGNPSEDTLNIIRKFISGQITTQDEAEFLILEKISKQLCGVCTKHCNKCNGAKSTCCSKKTKQCKKCCGGCCGKSKKCCKDTEKKCCGGCCGGKKGAEAPIKDGVDGIAGMFASCMNKAKDMQIANMMGKIALAIDAADELLSPLFNQIFNMTWSENLKWIPNMDWIGVQGQGTRGLTARPIDTEFNVLDSTSSTEKDNGKTCTGRKKGKCCGKKCKGGGCCGKSKSCCNKLNKCCKWKVPEDKIPKHYDFLQNYFQGAIAEVTKNLQELVMNLMNQAVNSIVGSLSGREASTRDSIGVGVNVGGIGVGISLNVPMMSVAKQVEEVVGKACALKEIVRRKAEEIVKQIKNLDVSEMYKRATKEFKKTIAFLTKCLFAMSNIAIAIDKIINYYFNFYTKKFTSCCQGIINSALELFMQHLKLLSEVISVDAIQGCYETFLGIAKKAETCCNQAFNIALSEIGPLVDQFSNLPQQCSKLVSNCCSGIKNLQVQKLMNQALNAKINLANFELSNQGLSLSTSISAQIGGVNVGGSVGASVGSGGIGVGAGANVGGTGVGAGIGIGTRLPRRQRSVRQSRLLAYGIA